MPEELINKTLDYADLDDAAIRPTVRSLRSWTRRWLLAGERLGVNGHVKRRWYIRPHKMWEYARGLALTETAKPVRRPGRTYEVLDVGGAMTAPIFYLAQLGDRVRCLDIDPALVEETNAIAQRRGMDLEASTTDLVDAEPTAADLGAGAEGFDRVYCFCVIEHIRPPGQARVAARMANLLKPGGELCITFDYGEHAPTEAPMYSHEHVTSLREAIGLPLRGNPDLAEDGRLYPLNRRYPQQMFTFGSLFFRKPESAAG